MLSRLCDHCWALTGIAITATDGDVTPTRCATDLMDTVLA